MTHNLFIHLPANKRLVWYLAAEEYFAKNIHSLLHRHGIGHENNNKDIYGIFFTWIVSPTVIFGRHQVMANEVNIPFCQANDIAMYRRKSGGGCVYADEGNLMISYISPSTHSEKVFQYYLDSMSECLQKFGYQAVKSTHNDIMVGDHKVSGNACFALPQATIVHGTMLYDVNFEVLQQAITPSQEKLAKHGVESVRQRVMNLKDVQIILEEKGRKISKFQDIGAFAEQIKEFWCNQTYIPTEKDIQEIDKIEQEYLNPDFIHSR
jgi:lipoic acid synthetase/lipoate-protein ligase A